MSTQPTDSAKKASSNDFNRQAGLYSLAATAAGVSLMVLAQPAAGEVVITNKNIPIPFCDGLTGPCPVSVYLNNDGIADFQLSLYDSLRTHRSTIRLTVEPLQGGAVVGTPPRTHRYGYASALLRGAKIGPSAHFLAGQAGIEESTNFEGTGVTAPPTHGLYGKWSGNHPNRFLGVKFLIAGATHYGWIRLTVVTSPKSCEKTKSCKDMSATITEYGYETIANKSLDAGLPGADSTDDQAQETGDRPSHPSLGMLALGTDGLALWRREEALVH